MQVKVYDTKYVTVCTSLSPRLSVTCIRFEQLEGTQRQNANCWLHKFQMRAHA